MEKNDNRPVSPITAFCVLVLLIVSLIGGVSRTLEYVYPELQFIQTYPNWSYDDKMHYRYGSFYDLMRFVQQHTPPDSTILIPPADPWHDAGNIYLVRSFLYPRKIHQVTEDVLRQSPRVSNSYALIATGFNKQIWPSAPGSYGNVTYIQPGWGVIDISKR